MSVLPVPRSRLRAANSAPIRAERQFVLLWLTGNRRVSNCFTTDHAVELALELDKPLVILDALRVGYLHACDRFHRFVLDGMADVADEVATTAATHLAYVERAPGEGSSMLEALASDAAVVVTDDHPGFFFPRMVRAAAARLDVRLVAVDSTGLVPLRLYGELHGTAYSFRRSMQKLLPAQLDLAPAEQPLLALEGMRRARIDAGLRERFVNASELRRERLLEELPIDHRVRVVDGRPGGPREAERLLARFVKERLPNYLERSSPDSASSSELSPYLHFGHIGVHRIVSAVAPQLRSSALAPNGGKREGYFGLRSEVEAFLDQLLVWRELGQHAALVDANYARYEGVPSWARATLEAHASDPRPELYDRQTLESARTKDSLWNAAQRELLETGTIQNYMRMLWGKKVLEWSASPAEAFDTLVYLNDRFALDGRDPNSYASIAWIFGRYDRPWGPTRPIFGTIRYMSSASTRRKLDLDRYLARYSGQESLFG